MAWIKNILKCGTIPFPKDGVWMFEVNNQKALNQIILPFFDRFRFLSKKKKLQYQKFKKICKLLNQTPSNSYGTIRQILILRNQSNIKTSKKRKYNDEFILQRGEFYWNQNINIIKKKNEESSETNTPNTKNQ